MIRWLRCIGPGGLLLLAGCHPGDDRAQIVHAGTPVAGLAGHTVDYRCEGGKTLRITYLGERAVVDTGYDRYSLHATSPGDDTYLSEDKADPKISLEADNSEARLTIKGGVDYKNCVAPE